jgi:hypothetical protein
VKLRRSIVFGVASLSALLVSSAVALAQVPGAYQGEGGEAQQDVASGGADTLGGLPFTGLDLALIVGAGLLLLIVGFSLRRFAARRTTTT